MKPNYFLISLVAFSLFLSSCSKDESDDFVKMSDTITPSGSCKIAITGMSENGYPLNESFELNYNNKYYINQYKENDDEIQFEINQESDQISNNSFNLSITYDKVTKEVFIKNVNISYERIIDSKNVLSIYLSSYSLQIDSRLSNFVYDKTNSKISGKVSMTAVYYGEGVTKTTDVAVDFNVNVSKIVNSDLTTDNYYPY